MIQNYNDHQLRGFRIYMISKIIDNIALFVWGKEGNTGNPSTSKRKLEHSIEEEVKDSSIPLDDDEAYTRQKWGFTVEDDDNNEDDENVAKSSLGWLFEYPFTMVCKQAKSK